MNISARMFAQGFLRRAEALSYLKNQRSAAKGLHAPNDWKVAVDLIHRFSNDTETLLMVLKAFDILQTHNVVYRETSPSADGRKRLTVDHIGFPYALIALLPMYVDVLIQHAVLHGRYLIGLVRFTLDPSPVHSLSFVKTCLEFILDSAEMWHAGVPASTQAFTLQGIEAALSYGVNEITNGSALERIFMMAYRYVCMDVSGLVNRNVTVIRNVINVLGKRVWILGSDICVELYCGLLEQPLHLAVSTSELATYEQIVRLLGSLISNTRPLADGSQACYLDPSSLVRVQDVLVSLLRVAHPLLCGIAEHTMTSILTCSLSLNTTSTSLDDALRRGIVAPIVRVAHGIVADLAVQKRAARSVTVRALTVIVMFLHTVSSFSDASLVVVMEDWQIVPVALAALPLFFNTRDPFEAVVLASCIGILANYARDCTTTRMLIVDDDRQTGVTLTLLLRVLESAAMFEKDVCPFDLLNGYNSQMLYLDVLCIMFHVAKCSRATVMQALQEEIDFYLAAGKHKRDRHSRRPAFTYVSDMHAALK